MYQAPPFSDDVQGQESQSTDPQADRQRPSDVDGCAKEDAQLSGDSESQVPKDTHAVLPDQLPAHEWEAVNKKIQPKSKSRKIEPSQALRAFRYHGPPNPLFTVDEQYIYSCAMKRYRKEFDDFLHLSVNRQEAYEILLKPSRHIFSIIAEVLPTRNYKECINYYYCYKGDSRFQNSALKEQDGKRDWKYEGHRDDLQLDDNPAPKSDSGRVAQATKTFESEIVPNNDFHSTARGKASAKTQVSGCDVESPDDQFIRSLKGQVSTHTLDQVRRIFYRKATVKYPPKVELRSPNVNKLEPASRRLFRSRPQYMLKWLRSAAVLVQLREWFDSVGKAPSCEAFLHSLPATVLIDLMLNQPRDTKPNKCLDICKLCILIIHNKSRYRPIGEPDLSHRFIANVLLWAYDECISDPQGFFGILLKSPLAKLQDYRVRRKLEDLYVLPRELTDSVQEPVPSTACDADEEDVAKANFQN